MRADFGDAEPGHRLVEQQQLRLGRERHRELELALLAMASCAPARRRDRRARRASSAACAGVAQAALLRALREEAERVAACACTASATLSAAVKSSSSEVIWNERASPSARGARPAARDVAAAERDAAGMRREMPGELADQRGLAGAVRTDDRVDLARGDVERDVVASQRCRRSGAPGLSTRSSGSATVEPPEQAHDAAAAEQHDQQQQRPHDQRPVFGDLRQELFQQQTPPRPSPGRTACPCRPGSPSP